MPDRLRGLVLAPRGRDAALAVAMLAEAGIAAAPCAGLPALVGALDRDAGFAIVTEEALATADSAPLRSWLDAQAEWSDFPFILLTERGGLERNPAASRYLELLGNVTFVERPFHPTTLVALVRAAIRGRSKQYDARDRLEALHREEERFRAAIAAVQGILWTNNAEGKMEGEQPGWAALTGQAFDEYQGFGWNAAVHPDDVQPTVDSWNAALAERRMFVHEHRVRRADGSWGEYSIRAIPTYRRDGAIREWVGVHTDVSAAREAQRALSELTETLEQRVEEAVAERNILADIVETTDSYIQVVDNDLKLLAINRAAVAEYERVFGRSPKVGQPLLDFIDHPDYRRRVSGIWKRALSRKQLTTVETFGRGANTRHYESKFTRMYDREGAAIGAFQIADDITDRVQAQERLAETQDALRHSQKMEAIGQLTGGVAHDFNNLLTVIRSSADLLRRADLPEERRRRYVDAISDTADRAAKLTQQLLAFSRRQALKPEVFDAGERVAAIAEMLRTVVGARVQLELAIEPGLMIEADAGQFETALVNLAVNARDAMEGAGRLDIAVSDSRDHVAVRVCDSGSGIPSELLPRLFEPFFTTKGVGKGTGLGLSQVYGFAKQSGGDISVDSPPDSGAMFTLLLPRTGKRPDAVPPRRAVMAADKGCILLVEDNDDVRGFAEQILSDVGYDTHAVASGDEALMALAQGGRYDLVFSDIIMQGMSGIELGRAVRQRYPHVPVVLTSGYSDSFAAGEANEFPLLPKPYSVEQMTRIIREARGAMLG